MVTHSLPWALLLLACIRHDNYGAHAFTSSNNKPHPPPLKGSSSAFHRDTLTKLHADIKSTNTNQQFTKHPKYKKYPKHTSKQRQYLKVFNSKLTKCDTASELLQMFMDQTSYTSKNYEGETTTAATHLAGARKVNSVNYATCLHRLARLASTNNNNYNSQDMDAEWKKTLSDPRFALLLCSLAEMGARADASLSVREGKEVVDQWEIDSTMNIDEGMRAADDVLSDIVGMSLGSSDDDAARNNHSSDDKSELERKKELAEASMNKLIDPKRKSAFSSRECSNICWALAKIRVVPPSRALPLGRIANMHHEPGNTAGNERLFVSLDEMSLDILSTSLKIRNLLFEEARRRKSGVNNGSGGAWIPELSRLAGKLMDVFAVQIIQEYTSRRDIVNDGKEISSEDGLNHNSLGKKGFNPQEMASALWAFAKAKRSDDVLFSAVAEELVRQTELMKLSSGVKPKPQEFANTLWAFATAGIRVEAHVKLATLMADTLDEGNGAFFDGSYFKPQELANSAWALATLHSKRTNSGVNNDRNTLSHMNLTEDDAIVRILRWVAINIKQQVDNFKPQELSNSVWAFSTIGFGYDESSGLNQHNDYTYVTSDAPMEDKKLVFDTLEIIAENALPRLEKFKAQELNNLAWGFARLGHRTEKAYLIFQGVADQLARRVHQFKPQDVGTTMWSLATVECPDHAAFHAGASRLNFQRIRLFKAQEMSNAVWALATAGFAPKYMHVFDTTLVPEKLRTPLSDIKKDPITECYAAVAGELMRRTHEFKDQELKDVLWAFSRIGIRHPSLFKAVAERIVGSNGRGFSTFSPQGIGNTVWSFARQAQISNEVVQSFGLDNVNIGTTGRLAMYETSCLDVGEGLIKTLFVKAAQAAMRMGLDRFRSQDLSNTCWAYSTLGMLHIGFFKQVEQQLMTRLRDKLNGQEIANLLWSFATLNAQPDPSLIDALSSHAYRLCSGKNESPDETSIAKTFNRQELANVLWSCTVLGRYHENLINTIYRGLFGESNDPQIMKEVYDDDGLETSSLMTMYYVQYAIEVEAPEIKSSLPKGFPAGWHAGGSCVSTNNMDDNQTSSSMLQLTISKLQKDVSQTLTQIGFENVLEYVIDAPTNQNAGDDFPENPAAFLSIDIANVDQRLGVEVDGPGHFVRLIDDQETTVSSNNYDIQFRDHGEHRVNGPTILKHRLLTALGWKIIHIPYWDYQHLKGDNEKQEYCRNTMDKFSSSWSR